MAESKASILVVDDDAAVGTILCAHLRQAGYDPKLVPSANDALYALAHRPIELVITDLRMPGTDGMELLRIVQRDWPDIPVVMISAHGTVPAVVEAMKAGAADFVGKPWDRDEIVFVVGKALQSRGTGGGSVGSRSTSAASGGADDDFVADSPEMRAVLETVQRAARGPSTVLIRGESGSGKEWVAHAIHAQSPRAKGPFIKVHCGALPDTLLESELFGYEKGAFSGATQRKPGRVELAQGGTLFLDEIGDITQALQVKLLQLLSEKRFERLGGTETLKADVRIVAATHQPLEDLVRQGKYREDLYYRFQVHVTLPPLRARPSDIEKLAHLFARRAASDYGKSATRFDASAIGVLRGQPWPGNVRQLQNFVEGLVALGDDRVITSADIEAELARRPAISIAGPDAAGRATPDPGAAARATPDPEQMGLAIRRRDAEKAEILRVLAAAKDNRTLAAKLLGISRRTLYNKITEYGIDEPAGT